MKRILTFCAAVAGLAALSGCDMLGGNRNNAADANATANTAVGNASADSNASGGKDLAAGGNAAAEAPAAPANGEVTRDFLVGRWTDTGDCSSTIEFRADGRFVAPTGEGLWVLDGDRLTFQGSSTVAARVQAPDANTIMLIHDDGTVGRSTRCTG